MSNVCLRLGLTFSLAKNANIIKWYWSLNEICSSFVKIYVVQERPINLHKPRKDHFTLFDTHMVNLRSKKIIKSFI